MGIFKNEKKCPVCDKVGIETQYDDGYIFYSCRNCGDFYAPDIDCERLKQEPQSYSEFQYNVNHLKSYLFYHKSKNRPFLVPKKEYDELDKSGYDKIYNLTSEMVENWYPKTFAEKIDLIILWISSHSNYMGEEVFVSIEDLCLLFFMYNTLDKRKLPHWNKELKFLLHYLSNQELLEYPISEDEFSPALLSLNMVQHINLTLSAKAWKRIYELQKNQVNNKNVFIAMSFNPAIENIYNAIDSAIRKAKCEVVSMKHRIHNKQIVPEMLRLIKESKILVMDISEPNFGAYYEAGYAQGLGKEVIITCKSCVMKKDNFPCDDKKGAECELLKKYSKPHFDIAQKQILVWEDEADLTEQLTEWIKFLVG